MSDVKANLVRYDLFDSSIISHGFTSYMRDYELVVDMFGDTGIERGRYLYTFTHCLEAHITTQFDAENWRNSRSDTNLDYEEWSNNPNATGYFWANYLVAYPGVTYQDNSPDAAEWSRRLGHKMHEILITTNVQVLRLLFHDLIVNKIGDVS